MDRTEKEQSASPPPQSDSTHLSVQTIIQRYDQNRQQQSQPQQYQSNVMKHSNFSKPDDPPSSDTGSDGHLYNTPEFYKKDQVEVFSNEPIVVRNGQTPPIQPLKETGNASASSSITLLTADGANRRLPITIWLGVIQLLLSVSLTALGGLMIARDAALANTGAGIWAGGICGIAGALGVINVRKARTGFLAISLICVASSTLAIALTGIGLVRDVNLDSANGAISAAAGLLVALSLHFVVSVLAVYYSALMQCSKSSTATNNQMVENAIGSNNSAYLSHQRVEQYFKSLSTDGTAKGVYPTLTQHKNLMKLKVASEKNGSANSRDKLVPIWVTQGGKHPIAGSTMPHPVRHHMVLVPAGVGNNAMPMMPMYPPQMIYPPQLAPPGMMSYPFPAHTMRPRHHHQQQQHMPPGSEMTMINNERLQRLRKMAKDKRSKRLRRKSESDMAAADKTRKAFTYTGLDRAIADSFLEQQEKNNGSSMDCTSLNGKCKDVIM